LTGCTEWVTRDERWPIRGPWLWAVSDELPQFYRELNGIDFGHALLGETLVRTQDPVRLEQARREVVNFIFSSPTVPPDEEVIAPTLMRLVWEVQRAFNWAHTLHRTIYDIYASDQIQDKGQSVQQVLAKYLEKPEAVTSHRLDLHGKLYRFPESGSFHERFPKFNAQIWSYHWLQSASYDLQLLGQAAQQRELMPRLIDQYHAYLRNPPTEWPFMPMMADGAPEFAKRYPELSAIFDNLHMLHDNIDDILSRSDLYSSMQAKREAVLKILPIYLHRNHVPQDRFADYHGSLDAHTHVQAKPPSAAEVLARPVPSNN